MRFVFFAVLLFSLSFASFGQSEILMEKAWVISCYDSNCRIDFDGILVVNGSSQNVLLITTEPEMDLNIDENGEIHVVYNGTLDNEEIELKASALVEIDYNTNIMKDPVLSEKYINSTELTEWDEDIAEEAEELAVRSSMLETIRNVVAWVHKNIIYDVSYFGKSRDAQTVYMEKRGVCVEYSHITIAMLNYLGIETRYVNGYVEVKEDVQAHAWVEAYIPDYGWLPLDPTFSQVGILDSSHLIVSYGLDQRTDYDKIISNKESAALMRLPTNVTIISMEEDAKNLSMEITFNNQTYLASMNIRNERNDYVYGFYSFYPPVGYGDIETDLLLLSPNELRVRNYRFDPVIFAEGFVYTLPVRASVNDVEASKTIIISKSRIEAEERTCPLAVILLLAVIKFAYKK